MKERFVTVLYCNGIVEGFYCRVLQGGQRVIINWILQSVTGGTEGDNKLDIARNRRKFRKFFFKCTGYIKKLGPINFPYGTLCMVRCINLFTPKLKINLFKSH
jgi:hypothetical protein